MDLIMDAVSATAHYLGDPPRAASASQRGTIPASITKREAIVMVTATATMYFFWPERLWIFKAVFNIVLLAWVTALVFDAREAGIEAWDGIPAWLKGYLGGGSGGGGVSGGALRVQRVSVVGGKNHGQIVVESLQVVVENIKAARLTQDVWGLVRAFIIRCLRVSLDYLEPGTLQESLCEQTPSKSPKSSIITPQKHRNTNWYGLLIRTPPVHGYGSFGPKTTFWDDMDMDMDMDPWQTPSPSALPWQSTSTSCIPPMIESLVADTHFSFCLIEKSVWESSTTALSAKLARGRYWDIRGENDWQKGEVWSEDEVRKVLGVEVLGLVEVGKGRDVLDACNHHSDTLRKGWEYRNISWNDIDFALLLGILVVGPKVVEKCKELFQTMETLRFEQFLVPRAQLSAGLATAMGAMAILGTGGLAAPFLGPMVLGKFGASVPRISRRDQVMWDQRLDAMRRLAEEFPQLRALVDGARLEGSE